MARLRDFETKNSLRGFRAVLFRMVSKLIIVAVLFSNIVLYTPLDRFRAVLFRMVSKQPLIVETPVLIEVVF
jgi:hypothetical protein